MIQGRIRMFCFSSERKRQPFFPGGRYFFSRFFWPVLVPLLSSGLLAYGPHTALDCLGCHDPHYAKAQKIFKVKNELMVNPRTGKHIDDVSALCLGCHNTVQFGGAGIRPIHLHMTHPVNVVPNATIALVPGTLLRKNMIQCVSCHDPHPSNPNWRYLRVDTEGGTKVGRFCESCHPAKADTAFYGVTRNELSLFTSMNERIGASSLSPWDENFRASNPTPVYIRPFGKYPNSIAPAYPLVASLPWIYEPEEQSIPPELARSLRGEAEEPTAEQQKQQEFNRRPYREVHGGDVHPGGGGAMPESSKEKESPTENAPDGKTGPAKGDGKKEFGLKEGALEQYGSSRYLGVMYDGIRGDFEASGVELIPVKDGFEGKGVLLKKVLEENKGVSRIQKLVFRIDGNMAFETGSARLKADAIQLVDRIARAMEAYPETTARVVGHTDSPGSRALNRRLSLARARTVSDRILKNGRIRKERITEILGMADREKIVDTQKAEPRNRRVEITVTPVERVLKNP